MRGSPLDPTDARILRILQEDGRISNAELARQVGLAPSAVFERVRRLEERGVIRGYEAKLDPKALGLGLTAYVLVRTDDRCGDLATAKRLAEIPEVQEVHTVAGEDCYLLKVRAADTEALRVVLTERFSRLPTLRNTRTTIVLSTIKESSRLLVPAPEEAHARR